jgi:demethylmenaquinone methyltransferase/2-methoxy-6-polyprenyl-1,4-benzoquinol methylase
MHDSYYEAGEHRAERVQDLFGQIAPRYDLINDLQSFGLHRAWKRKAVRLARVGPGMCALDICCGTGDMVFTLRKYGATVMGVDFSLPMLRVALRRGAGAAGGILLMQGDAQGLPFPDKTFDAVTVGYGLRNLANWRRGLGEMWRVAKPGGRLVVLDFGKPDHTMWRALYFAYLRWAVPVFGKVFCKNASAYAYILESLGHYSGQRGIEAQMRELGCQDVRVMNLLGGAMSINFGIR